MKKHITIPQEFHFATDERISQPCPVVDIFDKVFSIFQLIEPAFYASFMFDWI